MGRKAPSTATASFPYHEHIPPEKTRESAMSSIKTTVTEKTTYALVGKTFEHFHSGEVIASGIILGMCGPTALQLVVQEEGKEWFEIHAATDLGYDRVSKTGYRFSVDNPYREQLIG